LEESLAFRAIKQKNLIEYMKVHTIVQTIGYAADVIATVSAGEQPPGPDKVNKLLESLKVMLLPETREELEHKSQKVKTLMEQAQNAGPFKVQAVVKTKRGKGLK
jgi:hypothetical protein